MRCIRRTLLIPLALFFAALLVTTLVYQFPVTSAVNVGSGGDAPFIQGFSFREGTPAHDFRWSEQASEIRLYGVGATDGTINLTYAVPPRAATGDVEYELNNQPRGALPSNLDFQTFTIPVTRTDIGLGGNLVLRINSNNAFTAPPDTRTLGIQVADASFTGTTPTIPPIMTLLYLGACVVLAFFIARAWTGSERAALILGIAAILVAAYFLYTARIQTAYFLAPLFWFALFLFGFAYLFSIALERLTNVLPAPMLTSRTLRLLFFAMSAAFAFRMFFATMPGYIVDVQDYLVWSYKTVTYGLGTMYSEVNGLWISDQSPGLNYILHLVGVIYRAIFAPDFLYPAVAGDPALRGITDNPALLADPVHRTLLRLPMLFCDVLTGALIFVTARKYLAEKFAWLAAFAYWFNPAVLWNGAYWGQTDAIHALLILVCFLLIIFTPRIGLAFFILGVAAFTKPQAMFFGPLLLLAVYVKTKASTPSFFPASIRDLSGVARALLFGALGSALLLIPVFLTGGTSGLLAYLLDAVGHHPTLSANAHNLWWMVFHDDVFTPDTAAIVPDAPLSFRTFSILLFALAYIIVLLKAWRTPLERYFVLGAYVAFAFFMLPTEIHENYGYALLPLLAVAMTQDTRNLALYIVLSITMTLNYALQDPPMYDVLGLSDPHAQLALARWLNAVANVAILVVWTISLVIRDDVNVSLKKLFLRQETVK